MSIPARVPPRRMSLAPEVAVLMEAVLDDVLRTRREPAPIDLPQRLRSLALESRRFGVDVDSLLLALRDSWFRHVAAAPSTTKEFGERFVRIAHAVTREYLRAEAQAVLST